MTRYVAGRVLAGLVTLLLFVTILFFLAEWLMPTREVTGEGSVPSQFVDYLQGLLSGDLFDSGALTPLPWTLLILVFAVGIAFPLGHWVGKWAGWRSGASGAPAVTMGAVVMYTVFPPLLVFVLIMVVSRFSNDQGIGFLRTIHGDELDPGTAWSMLLTIVIVAVLVGVMGFVATRRSIAVPKAVWALVLVGLPLLVWVGRGMWSDVEDVILYFAMPVIAVSVIVFGEAVLVTKSTTAEAAGEDFVFTARAKGESDSMVRDHHVGRFTLLPILSKLMVSVPFILVGLMIIEMSFAWPKFGAALDPGAGSGLGDFGMEIPGLSTTLFTSLEARDTATVLDGLIVVGIVVLGLRLLIELLHAVLDPRIRVGSRAS
jgi:ABC-type dipeptide/oligopeptide/nickel transport system permease component